LAEFKNVIYEYSFYINYQENKIKLKGKKEPFRYEIKKDSLTSVLKLLIVKYPKVKN
jgi:hypothetical protein